MAEALTRILHIIPALEEGGAERVVVNTAIAEKSHGLQPIVISSGGKMVSELEAAGIEQITWPVASKNPLKIMKNGIRLAALIRERDINIVHVHSRAPAWSGMLACRISNTPLVATFHGVYRHQNIFKRCYNSVMTRADAIIVPSQFVKRHLLQVYNVDPADITIVPPWIGNPVPVSQNDLDEFRRSHGLEDGQPVFCVVGRLSRLKGHEIVLRALTGLGKSNARLLIVGSEQREGYLAELTALTRQLGIADRVVFTGGGSEIPRLAYRVSRAVISASTHPESFGLTMLEAASCGLPAIATAHGGVLDLVVDGKNGWLVPPGDAEALGEAMRQLLRLSDEEYADLCSYARRQAENFASVRSSAELLNVYHRLQSKAVAS